MDMYQYAKENPNATISQYLEYMGQQNKEKREKDYEIEIAKQALLDRLIGECIAFRLTPQKTVIYFVDTAINMRHNFSAITIELSPDGVFLKKEKCPINPMWITSKNHDISWKITQKEVFDNLSTCVTICTHQLSEIMAML